MIDFTNCQIEQMKFYDGLNGKKIAIYYQDELYMLKFPKENHINDNYASSIINEYIGSHIFASLGFETQETLLGNYQDKIAVACKDFEGFEKRLMNFGKVKNSIISGSNSSFADTDLQDTLNTIHNQRAIDSVILESFFWEMFVADTLIANFDRHNGNWGLLVDNNRKITIAPIYDCGSCLYPKLSNADIESYLNHRGSLNDLLLNQTTSAITTNGKKINPQRFLMDSSDENIIEALNSVIKRINTEKLDLIIESVDFISVLRKDFYKIVLKERSKVLNRILQNALSRRI